MEKKTFLNFKNQNHQMPCINFDEILLEKNILGTTGEMCIQMGY